MLCRLEGYANVTQLNSILACSSVAEMRMPLEASIFGTRVTKLYMRSVAPSAFKLSKYTSDNMPYTRCLQLLQICLPLRLIHIGCTIKMMSTNQSKGRL